ncbi:Aste57867_23153 [Aphanomyces stellatus]|uniref:Aste57867_23153 protein n=1 Tax=Aphanomyces stellatus TaxID=120398 RepID=A0A485LM43_9STRA|nr:hypothetical protein As57867_023082 [Aphanomyces stellatus]VFT99801.1 Aste57867_23153 [Aphanomyces stellatus]
MGNCIEGGVPPPPPARRPTAPRRSLAAPSSLDTPDSPLSRRSSLTFDAIRPMLAQCDNPMKLQLVLVMVGEKSERCVIPRSEVRRLCKKDKTFKQKINDVVRSLRTLNATLLDALPHAGSTEWTIANGEFDILKAGAQDCAIRDFNATLAGLKDFIASTWETAPGPDATVPVVATNSLFGETAAKLHILPPSPVASTVSALLTGPAILAPAKRRLLFQELNVMSHSEAKDEVDESTTPTPPTNDTNDEHKRSSSWGWKPQEGMTDVAPSPSVDAREHRRSVSWGLPSWRPLFLRRDEYSSPRANDGAVCAADSTTPPPFEGDAAVSVLVTA